MKPRTEGTDLEDDEAYLIDTSQFQELGLSDEFAQWVQRQRYPRAWKRRAFWQLAMGMGGLLVVGVVVLSGTSAIWNALEAARIQAAGAVFHYDHRVGFSLVIGLFAAIFGGYGLQFLLYERLPARQREHDILSSLILGTRGHGGHLIQKLYRWLFRGLAVLPADQQFEPLARLVRSSYLGPARWLALLFVILFVRDFRDYSLVTPAGASTHNTWTTAARHSSWHELTEVRVGCWLSKKDPEIFYVTHFQNGAEVNLLGGQPKAHDFALAEFADQVVHERGIRKRYDTFSYGADKGKDRAHPGCADALNTKYPPEVMEQLYVLLTLE